MACSCSLLTFTCLIDIDLYLDYNRSYTGSEVMMKLSSRIKPISYLKAHASEIVRDIGGQKEPLIITQNGTAKAIIQDIESYEQTMETMALLKILALGNKQVDEGKIETADDVITRIRDKQKNT